MSGAPLSVWLLVFLSTALSLGGCSFSEVSESTPPPPDPGDPVLLVDLTGKTWDISTAVWKYGFEVERFEFGLGPMAIKPILNPQMLSPGDELYPEDNKTFDVIGTSIGADSRAYGLMVIVRHEVIDDHVGDAPLAVTY
jgi:hypothetical protein